MDYKGIFAQESHLSHSNSKLEAYSVKVVEGDGDGKIHWRGEVMAKSKVDARKKWREEFPEIRSKFDHSFALLIGKIY